MCKTLIYNAVIGCCSLSWVVAYSSLVTIAHLNPPDPNDQHCAAFDIGSITRLSNSQYDPISKLKSIHATVRDGKDPMLVYQDIIHNIVFGGNSEGRQLLKTFLIVHLMTAGLPRLDYRNSVTKANVIYKLCILIGFNGIFHIEVPGVVSDDDTDPINKIKTMTDKKSDRLAQYPSGNVMRAELFLNRTAVHLPISEYLHRSHCRLRVTRDYMQTAVDAFAIFLKGSLEDIFNLPPMYVLRSARTIAMMKITREKYVATWAVVKGNRQPDQVPFETLELYRPLFKYLSGKEIARLNLSDPKILTYIGTHADLNRHQVGVVASRYIKTNRLWAEPKYLNLMNNLLCGVPMTFMRRIPENTYLQLSDQVFYHIRACDPLQRRFYLNMMTKTQALGKSYSWSARDVSRLGLLLAEVEGSQLSTINPEAMSGITAQVMMVMPARTLRHITEVQLRYVAQKPLNILARKLKIYQDEHRMFNHSNTVVNKSILGFALIFIQTIKVSL